MVQNNDLAILITGGSGFLGTYLARACVQAGYRIYGIDRKPPAQPELWAGFTSDSVQTVDLADFLDGVPLQTCFHLAGSASVPFSVQHPFEDFNRLLPGTAKLLEYIATRQKQCHFVLFSSAAVYGNPTELPISEASPASPLSPYGVHKYLAEELLRQYSSIYSLTVSVLRIFSAYGVGLRRQLFWDTLCKYFEAHRKEETFIEFFGTGTESRDFIHAADVARAAVLVSENPKINQVQVVNIANGEEVSIKDAIYTLLESAPRSIAVQFNCESRSGDPSRWLANISYLKSIGYQPSIRLESGLAEYFLYHGRAGEALSVLPRPS